jgi:Family of unknown function (DUF5343)
MAQTIPYLSSNKNVSKLFEKILSAQKPSTFTHQYLQNIIGLKGTNDRPLIPFLRTLGFLDSANAPTSAYDLLKNQTTARKAIGAGVKKAYEGLFKANEKANELGPAELKGLLSQVSGADEKMVERSAGTFAALAKLADFSGQPDIAIQEEEETEDEEDTEESLNEVEKLKKQRGSNATYSGLRPEFHYNIQIHLPGNGTEETYLNIFNALRRTFK